jgi:hypothetical protein
MNGLQQIESQLKSEITVQENGQTIATIRGVARLCGVAHPTLVESYKGTGRKNESKLATSLAQYGFECGNFSETGVPDIAVALTVSYYANKAGARCTELARQVNDVFLAVGARVWMQKVVGWSEEIPRQVQTEKRITRGQPGQTAKDYLQAEQTKLAIVQELIDDNDWLLVEIGRISKIANAQTFDIYDLQAELEQFNQKALPPYRTEDEQERWEQEQADWELRAEIPGMIAQIKQLSGRSEVDTWKDISKWFMSYTRINLYVRSRNDRINPIDLAHDLGQMQSLHRAASRVVKLSQSSRKLMCA